MTLLFVTANSAARKPSAATRTVHGPLTCFPFVEKTNLVSAEKGASLGVPDTNSHGEFIIEHYWGYTRRGASRTDEYKVEHPKWNLFEAKNARIDVDFSFTYGEKFGFLTKEKPQSVLLAEGSEIAVYKGAKLIN